MDSVVWRIVCSHKFKMPVHLSNPTARATVLNDHLMFYDTEGNGISCDMLDRCVYDLIIHEHISHEQAYDIARAMNECADHGVLPGMDRFYSPWSRTLVMWPRFISDIIALYTLAVNFADMTDSEEENTDPNSVIDLWEAEFPTNIGIFSPVYGMEQEAGEI